jgi:hypothetical protein
MFCHLLNNVFILGSIQRTNELSFISDDKNGWQWLWLPEKAKGNVQ